MVNNLEMSAANPQRKPLTMSEEEAEQSLSDFSKACVSVAKMLQEGPSLSDLERLSIENHLAIVQLNYACWVRQFGRKPHSV